MDLPATAAPAQTAAIGAAAAPQAAATKTAAARPEAEQTTPPPPTQLDLLPLLEASPQLRSDLLFFIRLAGTYCQSIFWQIFRKGTPAEHKRRKKLVSIVTQLMENSKPQKTPPITGKEARQNGLKGKKEAETEKPKLNAKSSLCHALKDTAPENYPIALIRQADILDGGFITLMQELEKITCLSTVPAREIEIQRHFTTALKQRYGLQWEFCQFIEAVKSLQSARSLLEHYPDKIGKIQKNEQKRLNLAKDNASLITILGKLLLPSLSNELLQSLRNVKHAKRHIIAGQAQAILDAGKKWRKDSIHLMFAKERPGREAGTRKKYGKNAPRRATSKPERRAFLNEKWQIIYKNLELAKTNLREHNFKVHYDFIGKENIVELFKALRTPLIEENAILRYATDDKKLNFTSDIIPLYILAVRLAKTLHYAVKPGRDDKQLWEIRNTLAHNKLFWLTANVTDNARPLPVEDIFRFIIDALDKTPASAFCDKIESLLRRENYALCRSEKEETAKAAKIRRFNKTVLLNSADDSKRFDKRRAVRKLVARWQKALQKAGQTSRHNLRKAGKNAI